MKAIYKREVKAYFTSPLAYVFLFVSMLVSGYFFYSLSIRSGTSDLSTFFGSWTFVFLIFIPVLTMRLFSEERKLKTDQILITSPVSISGIVFAKFFAALTVVLISIGYSLLYIIIVAIFGKPQYGMVITLYLGFILLSATFVAIGIFISSITESQVVAAVVTMGIFFLMYTISWITPNINNAILVSVLNYISVMSQMGDLSGGLLNIAPILYFISLIVIFLFLTVRVIEKRRWS